jgi:hypothetical protein
MQQKRFIQLRCRVWALEATDGLEFTGNTEQAMEMIVKTTILMMTNMMIVKAMMVVKTTIRTTKARSESQRLGEIISSGGQ